MPTELPCTISTLDPQVTPRHPHDCEHCEFIASLRDSDAPAYPQFDAYFCEEMSVCPGGTLLLRSGSAPWDYWSMPVGTIEEAMVGPASPSPMVRAAWYAIQLNPRLRATLRRTPRGLPRRCCGDRRAADHSD